MMMRPATFTSLFWMVNSGSFFPVPDEIHLGRNHCADDVPQHHWQAIRGILVVPASIFWGASLFGENSCFSRNQQCDVQSELAHYALANGHGRVLFGVSP